MKNKIFRTIFLLLALASAAAAQIAGGGAFTLEKSVVAAGGGASAGGAFTLTGTSGQPAAGTTSANAPFSKTAGFWIPEAMPPTAALVSVGGRVTTAGGAGIRSVVVTLTDSRGGVRTVVTGSFGAYRFNSVEVGETYVLTVTAKKYVFADPTRIVSVDDELTGLDFVADEN